MADGSPEKPVPTDADQMPGAGAAPPKTSDAPIVQFSASYMTSQANAQPATEEAKETVAAASTADTGAPKSINPVYKKKWGVKK